MLIGLYLFAIVAANLSIAAFGPSAAIINAFLFIGFDLTARDALHQRWRGHMLAVRMGTLIGAGSVLSWLVNRDAGTIAIASCVAFAAAATADGIVYTALYDCRDSIRINGSNIVAALVDSLLFCTLAFGFPILWPIILLQFSAKVGGGAAWSILLTWIQRRRNASLNKP